MTCDAEFNETQTTKRSAYRKKVAVSRKGKGSGEDGADASMAETDGDTTMGNADTTANSVGSTTTTGVDQHRTKKARTDGTGGEGMDVDEEEQDASDPESVPNEDDDDEEEAQEEDEEEGDEQEGGQEEEGDQDELEERENRVDEDEALDDGNNSD